MIAEIIQHVNPDVLFINEFDFDDDGRAANLFKQNYLAVNQNGAGPVDYPYVYVAPSNTGVPSGKDLDNSGRVGEPNDAFGCGLFPDQYFVIMSDLNADPLDGDSTNNPVRLLLNHSLVNTEITPASEGGIEAANRDGQANESHLGDPRFDAADFAESAPGNLRTDYVLPSKHLKIKNAGVFRPVSSDPLFSLIGTFSSPGSDHHLVWVDVNVPQIHKK